MYYTKIHESSDVSDVVVTENTQKKEHNPVTELQELKGCIYLGLNKADVLRCHECVSLNNFDNKGYDKKLMQ